MECQGIPAWRDGPDNGLQDTKYGLVLGARPRGTFRHLAMICVNMSHPLYIFREAQLRGWIADNLWQCCVRHGMDMGRCVSVPFQIAP